MKLPKRLDFKVYGSDNKRFERVRFEAHKGHRLTEAQQQKCIRSVIEGLNDKWPNLEFYIVKVSRTQYSVFHRESVGNG